MRMRQLGSTGITVSEIGLGCEHLQGKPEEQVLATVGRALEGGINFLEVFMSEPKVRTAIGKAIRGTDTRLQGHVGSVWKNGQYAVSRDYRECKDAFEDLLTRLGRDTLEVGMLHFLDNPEEWDRFAESDTMGYLRELRQRGVISAVGMSCHNPVTAIKAVESGLVEVLMFSLNPVYDRLPPVKVDDMFGEKLQSTARAAADPTREALYALCGRRGVGITVMKAMAAGILLGPGSPLGSPMTPLQCAAYALSRPAVSSVMLGAQTPEEVETFLRYETASPEELDFSRFLQNAATLQGKCVYCNHCLPCPAKLDIAAVSKYIDLAEAGETVPATVAAHYAGLSHTAGECLRCGLCESRCPFGVEVRRRMDKAVELFGI